MMTVKMRFLIGLIAAVLLPCVLALQGCMNPLPSIMTPTSQGGSAPGTASGGTQVPGGSSPMPGGGGSPLPSPGGGLPPAGGGDLPEPGMPSPNDCQPSPTNDCQGDSDSGEGESGGEGGAPGGSSVPPDGSSMPGDSGDGSGGDGGWETSNELPDPLGVPSSKDGPNGQGNSDKPAEEDDLGKILDDFDRDVLESRTQARDKDNNSRADNALPGESDGALEPAQQSDQVEEKTGPVDAPRPGIWGQKVERDARDDDVIARQLREAWEAETDLELKEALWNELQRYKRGK